MRTQLRCLTWSTWTHFSRGTPPFDALTPEQLHELTAQAAVIDYEPGAVLLVEDGTPATGLWVSSAGSLDVVHHGEVIQVLEPGECFGHPSLLTGMAPGVHRTGARALELRAVRRPTSPGACWDRGRRRLCRAITAQAADPRRAYRPRPARRRHDAGVGDHAPARLRRSLRDDGVRRRGGWASTTCRRCSCDARRDRRHPHRRRRARRRRRTDGSTARSRRGDRALARADRPGAPAGDRGDRRHARRRGRAPGRARRRADLWRAVGRRPAGARRQQPDRPAPHDPRRRRRRRPGARGLTPAAAVPRAEARGRSLARPRPGAHAWPTTPSWRG